MPPQLLQSTRSRCPICNASIRAERLEEDGRVFLRQTCPKHGSCSALIWSGRSDYNSWIAGGDAGFSHEPSCPDNCGLCSDHLQETCCTLLEVTPRCNLSCTHCFADGGEGTDPGQEEIKIWINQLVKPGKTLLQLSGGEPTLRDDLPELVAYARVAGCAFVQLNSNGIRLAEDPQLAKNLASAGLSFVFMQFDGLDDQVYQALRGRPLLEVKKRAIDACAKAGLGLTLVPTLVPGVNLDQIGPILHYALSASPVVRGVHFQPLGQLGRRPEPTCEEDRLTLDELVYQIEEQTGGMIRADQLEPSHCNHPLCGFHGDFVVLPDCRLMPLSRRRSSDRGCCGGKTTADQNRAFITRRWQRPAEKIGCDCQSEPRSLDGFIERVQSHGFTVTAMAFQDRYNFDIERLRRCSLHIFDKNRFVPFCAHYIKRDKPS